VAIDNPNGRSSLDGFSPLLSDVTEDTDGFSLTLVDVIIGKGVVLVRRSGIGLNAAAFSPTFAVITSGNDVGFSPTFAVITSGNDVGFSSTVCTSPKYEKRKLNWP
jgi:hypothetical protein